jgi:predicted nucleic acid-binding protein
MIAVDTSTWVSYLEGGTGEDVRLLDEALQNKQVVMVPAVLTELLSDPKLPANVAKLLGEIPQMEIETGFWERAGALRATALAKRRRARLGDALLAQTCLDGAVALVTRDRDFGAFVQGTGLAVLPKPI